MPKYRACKLFLVRNSDNQSVRRRTVFSDDGTSVVDGLTDGVDDGVSVDWTGHKPDGVPLNVVAMLSLLVFMETIYIDDYRPAFVKDRGEVEEAGRPDLRWMGHWIGVAPSGIERWWQGETKRIDTESTSTDSRPRSKRLQPYNFTVMKGPVSYRNSRSCSNHGPFVLVEECGNIYHN
jgi:hypothetical protein